MLRAITDDYGNRLALSRCGKCRHWLERCEENFGPRARHPDGTIARWDNFCRPCRRGATRKYYRTHPEQRTKAARRAKRARMNPEARARIKAHNRSAMRERRKRHPEKGREESRKYYAKIRQDPQRYAEYLARQRFNYALRQERKGKPVKSRSAKQGGGPELPVAPLHAAVERYLRRVQWAGGEESAELVALRRIGLEQRTVYAWRRGERHNVRLDVADRVLLALGLNWFDVYCEPVNGHSDDAVAWAEYHAARLVFEGEPS